MRSAPAAQTRQSRWARSAWPTSQTSQPAPQWHDACLVSDDILQSHAGPLGIGVVAGVALSGVIGGPPAVSSCSSPLPLSSLPAAEPGSSSSPPPLSSSSSMPQQDAAQRLWTNAELQCPAIRAARQVSVGRMSTAAPAPAPQPSGAPSWAWLAGPIASRRCWCVSWAAVWCVAVSTSTSATASAIAAGIKPIFGIDFL